MIEIQLWGARVLLSEKKSDRVVIAGKNQHAEDVRIVLSYDALRVLQQDIGTVAHLDDRP